MGERNSKWLFSGVLAGLVAWSSGLGAQSPESQLHSLAAEFDQWRQINQSVSRFATLRIQRLPGWEPDWSRMALDQRQEAIIDFRARLKSLGHAEQSMSETTNATMLGAGMNQVYWNLEILSRPQRDPGFYLDQTLGAVFEILVRQPEPGSAELSELIVRLKRFPAVFNAARLNLDQCVPLLQEWAIERLDDSDDRIMSLQDALSTLVPENLTEEFETGIRAAQQSLASYKNWLSVSNERCGESEALGEARLKWYLGHVAMVPEPPESILSQSEWVLAQLGTQLALSQQRHSQSASPAPLEESSRLIQMLQIGEGEIRNYLENSGLLTLDNDENLIQFVSLPAHLSAVSDNQELVHWDQSAGVRYIPGPTQTKSYLDGAAWLEPRLLVTWESIPGRFMLFNRASSHEEGSQRHYADPTLNTGILLYLQQQLIDAGLFVFKPASHQLAVKHMAYQAALARADIKIALGQWTSNQASEFLISITKEDQEFVASDLKRIVANPGMAASSFATYGQIIRLLADVMQHQGDEFSLTAFNDQLLKNARVPIALQRLEILGEESELEALSDQRGRPATVPQ